MLATVNMKEPSKDTAAYPETRSPFVRLHVEGNEAWLHVEGNEA